MSINFTQELRYSKNCEAQTNIECIEVRFQITIEVERFGLRKSATIQAAPVIAKFCALPAQLINLCGSAKGAGSHTSSPKPMSIAVSKREARRAERPESRAMDARANAIVVVIAQNICPGGIHFGTKAAVPERMSCSVVNETTQIPKNRYPIRAAVAVRSESPRLKEALAISAP